MLLNKRKKNGLKFNHWLELISFWITESRVVTTVKMEVKRFLKKNLNFISTFFLIILFLALFMSENIVSHSSWKNLLTRFKKFTLMWTKLLSGKWNAQGPHSHILMRGGGGGYNRGSYFIPQKIPTSEFVYPKKSLFFSIPKKIPQCFCISKFYYLSSGKLKHANFNFGFGQKQNYKLRLCYCWFELMKNTIPKKIPVLFSRPKKIPASFIDPKKSLLAKMSDPKKSFGPPRH